MSQNHHDTYVKVPKIKNSINSVVGDILRDKQKFLTTLDNRKIGKLSFSPRNLKESIFLGECWILIFKKHKLCRANIGLVHNITFDHNIDKKYPSVYLLVVKICRCISAGCKNGGNSNTIVQVGTQDVVSLRKYMDYFVHILSTHFIHLSISDFVLYHNVIIGPGRFCHFMRFLSIFKCRFLTFLHTFFTLNNWLMH